MRPGEASVSGFLGTGERLTEVVARDQQSLIQSSLAAEQIADRLESIVGQAFRVIELSRRRAGERDDLRMSLHAGGKPWILVEGQYLIRARESFGFQDCPFEDADGRHCRRWRWAGHDFKLIDITDRAVLSFPGLSIHLIRDHHFFEGEVPYRVDPLEAARFLGIRPGTDYRPNWAAESIWELVGGVPKDQLDRRPRPIFEAPDQIEHVLANPEDTIEISAGTRVHFRGELCVVAAERTWTLPGGELIKGGVWTEAEGYEGTWCFEKRVKRYVEPANTTVVY